MNLDKNVKLTLVSILLVAKSIENSKVELEEKISCKWISNSSIKKYMENTQSVLLKLCSLTKNELDSINNTKDILNSIKSLEEFPFPNISPEDIKFKVASPYDISIEKEISLGLICQAISKIDRETSRRYNIGSYIDAEGETCLSKDERAIILSGIKIILKSILRSRVNVSSGLDYSESTKDIIQGALRNRYDDLCLNKNEESMNFWENYKDCELNS